MRNTAPIVLLFVGSLLLTSCFSVNMLDDALDNPQNTTTLRIQNVRMDSLPKEIGQLTHLKTLYLFRNKMQYIPEEIGNLKNLENLVISSNRQSSQDFDTMINLFNSKDFHWALFMGHLVLDLRFEPIDKAHRPPTFFTPGLP